MADKHCVIDTNVLIYSTVDGNPWYDEARQWLAGIQSGGDFKRYTEITLEPLPTATGPGSP